MRYNASCIVTLPKRASESGRTDSPAGSQADRLLSPQELADYLDVPVKTIYSWRYYRKGPPGFRVGKHVRFRWRDVEAWISELRRRDVP